MEDNENTNQNDNNMMTDICENPSPNEKRSSPRIEKLKAQKHQQQTPVNNSNKKKKTMILSKSPHKVEESRNGVENNDVNMTVCEEQQVEESRNGVENKEILKVCEEKKAAVEESVKRMEKRIFDVSKRQKVEEGEEKLQMKAEFVENEMTEDEKRAYAVVTEALRTFYKYYLHAVQEEETRCGKTDALQKNMKSSKPKKGEALDVDVKKGARRPDLKALTKMRETNTILYPNKIGSIPGIEVGKQFFSRAEMVAVGFNSHWLNGIDCITHEDSEGSSGYNLPIAVVIVMSGQYEDDLDNSEDVVYTGQGGNKLCGNRRQFRDQVLEKGNLGLKNSMEQCVPVRVVRGHECKSSYVGKVYTYDGLYKVVKYWSEKGVSGFNVFKFQLKRLEGQPLLTTDQVQFAGGQVPKSVSDLRGLVCEDISDGQENVPIPATNLVDDPPFAPTGFAYCNSIQVSEPVKLPVKSLGCNCSGNCAYSKTCSCATLNGSNLPYVHRDGGRLIEPKAVVYECGPNCGCGPGCVNRISQRGIKYRLEVYRTPKKGWAVRSWDYIPSGAPVCEYIGKLMKTDDVDAIPENNYIFDIDCLQTMKGLDGRERRLGGMCIPSSENDDDKDSVPEFCLDAGPTGNVARFINHSCQPNLFVQCVLSTHHDIKQARVVLFAADNIPPMKELTYDYGYALNSVVGPDGTIKQLLCYCGAAVCRKRLF
ncbi:histone-lysine N-methyltransferase, H3 lysine-9 specific SUVH4 [Heracleum sosnowskyi]|uniref:Histone-lysine N-methyltransferase, H3 lysine-9 specific SUVH4 n=1 Tax=Heracleum sosnowskyi TaxID=360622 RepID=A0AAD8HNW6_9APIA|nr:histone-lysine N-methyltransferase, H3 lysine-9 specific SUVH4 [Heracleum sosnowskyi]